MSEKYQMEIDNFIQRFALYKDLRIVLYGIGRYTVTLLENLKGFNIVGLMDKDPANLGRVMHDIPVVDISTAEQTADLIIINTAETYWDVIYNRIKEIRLPVYYLNGQRALPKESKKTENPFMGLSHPGLLAEIAEADVVSFDFFDTLFMRSVCNPHDIFRIMEKKNNILITQVRDHAKKLVRENYSLDELYEQMEILENAPHDRIQAIKQVEMKLEKKLLVPRMPILSLLKKLLNEDREIYLISDMYLPKIFYIDVLADYGILIPDKAILLSNELNANKFDGTLWEYYAANIVKDRIALHIGDAVEPDIKKPMEHGIKTYLTPSAWELFLLSSLKNIAPYICNIYDTSIMGCILNKLFEDPFVLNNSDAVLRISKNQDMGYCVFGPVVMTFLLWIIDKITEDNIEKLVFMSRDGYFLKEDFEYLCELIGIKKRSCYIGISRQLAMMASIETRQELLDYVHMPYSGSVVEMLEDRFGINCVENEDVKTQEEYIAGYLPEIEEYIAKTRKKYLCYLEKFKLDNKCAVVDIGYYGNNQRFVNKLLGIEMAGYYFNANLSDKNENARMQKMIACFQSYSDATGGNSQILKKQIYLESFLTAPYGMVKAVDTNGNFVCAPNKKNQEYFKDKEEINKGVKQFMADYIDRFGDLETKPESEFIDQYYGVCFSGGLQFDDEVKKSFYNDNAMMNRFESSLFY